MFNTYDEFLAANEPKFLHKCPKCKQEYFSGNGDIWRNADGYEFNFDPVQDGRCVLCETESAIADPLHWASMEVLATPEALARCLRETLNVGTEERGRIAADLLKLLLQNEEFKDVAAWYLRDNGGAVLAQVEDKFY